MAKKKVSRTKAGKCRSICSKFFKGKRDRRDCASSCRAGLKGAKARVRKCPKGCVVK